MYLIENNVAQNGCENVIAQTQKSLSDWLNWLEQLDPTHIELGLERVNRVYQRLNLPKLAKQIVVIGGTNGKGSTAALIEHMAHATGLRTGVYASPHLLEFNERIRILTENIDDQSLTDAFAFVFEKKGDVNLTYFEFTTLAAFVIFSQHHLDLAILEVGLGGRLDAVNIIDADCAIITNVGLDHTEWLGENRELIGGEKARIYRANKPAIFADINVPESVVAYAKSIKATYLQYGQDFGVKSDAGNFHIWSWFGQNHGIKAALDHQPMTHLGANNAATALQALSCLNIDLSRSIIEQGLQNAHVLGRFMQMTVENTEFIFDVAHNAESVAYLIERLQATSLKQPLRAMVGILRHKQWQLMLSKLIPYVDEWRACSVDDGARFCSADEIVDYLVSQGVRSIVKYPSVEHAIMSSLSHRDQSGSILVFGSFITCGKAYHQLNTSQIEKR